MMVRSILLLCILVITSLTHAAELSNQTNSPELRCLTRAVYFEANRSDVKMQQAVASVIINRVNDARYPNTICGVVHQQVKNTCQFSWYCEPKRQINDAMWQGVLAVTSGVLQAWETAGHYDITHGATHYHDSRVKPTWTRSLRKTYVVDTLTFYK